MAAHDDARELLLQHMRTIGRSHIGWQPNALYTSHSQTDLLVPKQKAMQAEDGGVTAHCAAPHSQVTAEGDDTIGSEHAPTAEAAREAAAAQGIVASSDGAKGIGDPPNARDEHAASIAAAAGASFSSETAATIVSTSDTIRADLHASSLSVTASMPEQSSRPWHDAAQQERIHTEDTTAPAAAQSTRARQQQSADSAADAAAPPFFASSDATHESTQAQAAPAVLKPSPQGSAVDRQFRDATVGADATTESATELGQVTPSVPGLSAADVRQLMRLMQSMQAAATWPRGAPADQMTTEQKGAHADQMTNEQKGAHADQITTEQRLPAEAAPAEQMTSEQRLPAKAATAGASEVTAVAYQIQAHADSRQLQVGRDYLKQNCIPVCHRLSCVSSLRVVCAFLAAPMCCRLLWYGCNSLMFKHQSFKLNISLAHFISLSLCTTDRLMI